MLFFFVFYILLEIVIFASVDLQCRLKIPPFLYHCHSAALFVGFFFFNVWYRCRHWYIWGSFLNERSNIQPLWIFCMRFALISSCSRCWICTVPSIFPSFLVTKLFFFCPLDEIYSLMHVLCINKVFETVRLFLYPFVLPNFCPSDFLRWV